MRKNPRGRPTARPDAAAPRAGGLRRWSLLASLPLLTSLGGGLGIGPATAYAGSYRPGRGRQRGAAVEWPGSGASPESVAAELAGAALAITSAPPVPTTEATSHCTPPSGTETLQFVVTTLADELFDGTETPASPDGAGLSLREAVGVGLACLGPANITFAPALAGGVVRRAHPGALIDFTGGPETATTTINGDIDDDGRPDILLSSRAIESEGDAGDHCDPNDNPNVLILLEGDPDPSCDVGGGSGAGWAHVARVSGDYASLRLRGLVVFDSEMNDGLMKVEGHRARLLLESALITDCRGETGSSGLYYTDMFEVQYEPASGGNPAVISYLELRNTAVVGNHDYFGLIGYYAGGVSIQNSTLVHDPAVGYHWFKTRVYMANSIALGQTADFLRAGSHDNVTTQPVEDVLEIHANGTPSIVLRSPGPADPDPNPAIDGGTNAIWNIDGDIFGNLRIVDGDADGVADVDIGAVELQAFEIGGTVTGLLGSGLVLQNNGGDDLPVGADGEFTFAIEIADGAAYAVTVLEQPTSPIQTCAVAGGGGTVDGAAVTGVTVTCGNSPPVADIGGPYTGTEGVAIALDGSGSSDPDGDIVSHEWDLDYDGVTFDVDATGATPSPTFPDDGTVTVGLRVTDSVGGTSVVSTGVELGNAAPVVVAGGDQTVDAGQPVSLAPALFGDLGTADTHSATVDWGDGTGAQPAAVDQDGETVSASHTYATAGQYTVTVTVTDDDGDSGSDTFEVTVLAVPLDFSDGFESGDTSSWSYTHPPEGG